MKLRGQEVTIEPINKVISFEIIKPQDNKFSISDQIYQKLCNGYVAKVRIGKREITLLPKTKYLFKEEVKSKFPGSAPWHRYWYAIAVDDSNQLELGL